MFKAGDKVRLLPNAQVDLYGDMFKVGDILVVSRIWQNVPYPVYTFGGSNVCWREDELELVNE